VAASGIVPVTAETLRAIVIGQALFLQHPDPVFQISDLALEKEGETVPRKMAGFQFVSVRAGFDHLILIIPESTEVLFSFLSRQGNPLPAGSMAILSPGPAHAGLGNSESLRHSPDQFPGGQILLLDLQIEMLSLPGSFIERNFLHPEGVRGGTPVQRERFLPGSSGKLLVVRYLHPASLRSRK
jgi:hypothetical protein